MVDSIKSFESLVVWQEALNLAVAIYEFTENFPKNEIFGITSQIRRSASSVSANIAEGFGRRTTKDKLHFYTIAYGSLLETKNFMYLAQRLEYFDETAVELLSSKITSCQKLLNASMKAIRE